MLATAGKVWALMIREVRLLGRSRTRLACILAVPLAGGIVCGWMTRTTALPPVYCLVVFLTLASVILAANQATRGSRALSGIAGRAVFDSAWVLTACLVLIAQAAVLMASAVLIGGFRVSPGILAGVVVVSLVVAAVVRRMVPADASRMSF